MEQKIKISLLKKIIIYLFLLVPIFQFYEISGISYDTLMTVLSVAILLFAFGFYRIRFNTMSKNLYPLYFFVLLYNLIITVIMSMFYKSVSSGYVILMLFLLFFVSIGIDQLSNRYFYFCKYFVKVYINLCAIISMLTILFLVIYLVTGRLFVMKVPFLTFTEQTMIIKNTFGYCQREGVFGTGIYPLFSEPSFMAQYLIPAIVCAIYEYKQKSLSLKMTIIYVSLISFAIFVSTSTLGILLAFYIIVFYSFIYRPEANIRNRALIVLVASIVAIVIFIASANINSKVVEMINIITTRNDKSYFRIYRGLDYFSKFPLFNQIFGIGFNNFTSFVSVKNIPVHEILSEDTVFEYLNGFSQAAVYNGLIGLGLNIFMIIRYYKCSNRESKVLMICIAVLMLSAGTYLRGMSIFYLTIAVLINNYDTLCKQGVSS